MIASSTPNRDTFKVTTPSNHEIQMTRLFDAPRRLVFEALTRPEHVRQWWGCLGEGYSVPVCELDLKVGGRWRFVNRHPQGEVTFSGEILEIVPDERLVYTEVFEDQTDSPSVVTTVLSDEGSKTRITVTARYASAEVRDFVLGTGMERGAGISYDRLEDLVARLSRG